MAPDEAHGLHQGQKLDQDHQRNDAHPPRRHCLIPWAREARPGHCPVGRGVPILQCGHAWRPGVSGPGHHSVRQPELPGAGGGVGMIRGDELDDSLQDWAHVGWDEPGHSTIRPSLLIGNGFSQNIWPGFNYNSLFNRASQNNIIRLADTDMAIFKAFRTDNFEDILRVLAESKAVSAVLSQDCKLLQRHENRIRKALIEAVHGVHIPPCKFSEQNRMIIATELKKYMSIYYTNYDLLIYWSMIKYLEYCREYYGYSENHFFDYFWSKYNKYFDIQDTGVNNKEQRSGVYFLHGGLHLYKDDIFGGTFKRKNSGISLLDSFGGNDTGEIPLFISEGTYIHKLQCIYQSDYLSFVFSCFRNDNNPLVVLGHRLGDSDRHIIDAINAHKNRHVAISIRKNGSIRKKKARFVNALPNVQPYFFDAATHPLLGESLRIEESFP